VKNEPEKREAQKRLAEEVTKFVHDETALQEAQKITQALFSGNVKDLTVKEIEQGLKNMPSFNTTNETKNIVDWLVE
ncbi:tyrosine--tRNA ligase, partial [Staphylococcus epidermidis]